MIYQNYSTNLPSCVEVLSNAEGQGGSEFKCVWKLVDELKEEEKMEKQEEEGGEERKRIEDRDGRRGVKEKREATRRMTNYKKLYPTG